MTVSQEDIPSQLKRLVDAPPEPLPRMKAFLYGAADFSLRPLCRLAPRGEVDLPRMDKVLVYAATGLGNALLFLPAYRSLRSLLPQARIWVLGPAAAAEIYRTDNFDIERFVSPEDYPGLLGKLRLIRLLRGERFDCSIRVYSVRGFWVSILTALSGSTVRIGHRYTDEHHQRDLSYVNTHVVPYVADRHEVELNLDLIRLLSADREHGGLPETDFVFRVRPEEKAFAKDFLHRHDLDRFPVLLGFHIGCSPRAPYKLWPPERFAELANRLVAHHPVKPVLFWGPSEREATRSLASRIPEAFFVPEPLPLVHTAALLERCQGLICNDSVLMHLGCALGLPVFALFGPTDPKRVGPYGPRHRVCRLGTVCSPCYEKRIPEPCLARTPFCLSELTVDHAFQQAREAFPFLQDKSAKRESS